MASEGPPTTQFEFNPKWDEDPAKFYHDILCVSSTLANSLVRRKIKPSELYNAWKNNLLYQLMNPEFKSFQDVIAALENMIINPPSNVELPSTIYEYLSQFNDTNSYQFYNQMLGLSPKHARQLIDAQVFPIEAMTMTRFDYLSHYRFGEGGFNSLKLAREQWLNSQNNT